LVLNLISAGEFVSKMEDTSVIIAADNA